MKHKERTGHPSRMLRLPDVVNRTALSRSEIYRRIAAGTFPAPAKAGARLSMWPEDEVHAWIDALKASRSPRGAGRQQ